MTIADSIGFVASWPAKARARPEPLSSSSQSGYTLVELLVVMGIASIMAAMMISGVRQLQGISQLGGRASAQSVADAVADRIAEDISGALGLPLLGVATDERLAFVGTHDEVRFSAIIRIGFLKQALREVSYVMEATAGRPSLFRVSSVRRLGRADGASGEEKFLLHPDIVGVRFRYMTRNRDGRAIWLDDWSSQMLPVAVQIEIELIEKDAKITAMRTVRTL